MTEIIENSAQLGLLTVWTVLAGAYAIRSAHRDGALLPLFYGSYVLGDIYWLLYLIFYGETPYIFYVSYISWYAGYLFLYLLLLRVSTSEERKENHPVLWLLPLFTAAMGIYYMQWGDYAGNLISAVLMTLLLWHAVRGLIHIRSNPEAAPRRFLYITVLVFCALEYAAWTASCFFSGDTLANPYFWFDFMMTPCAMLILPAYRKAVEA